MIEERFRGSVLMFTAGYGMEDTRTEEAVGTCEVSNQPRSVVMPHVLLNVDAVLTSGWLTGIDGGQRSTTGERRTCLLSYPL